MSSSSSSSSPPPSSSKRASAAVLLQRSSEEEEEGELQVEWIAHDNGGTNKETNSNDEEEEEQKQAQEANTRTKEFRGRHHHNRPRNPFSERQRNNFPNWEDVFATEVDTPAAKMGATGRKATTIIKTTTTTTGSDAGASSSSSSSSLASTSILNMSIGARAALNEHLRHVHKYGIDGEKTTSSTTRKRRTGDAGSDDADADDDDDDADHNHNDINNSDSENDIGIPAPPPSTTRRRRTTTTKTTIQSSLDHHWESLLDSSFHVNTSFGPGSSISINSVSSISRGGAAGAGIVGAVGTGRRSIADVPSHHQQHDQDQHYNHNFPHNNNSNNNNNNENSVEEVMTDVSTDFFNSSRVEQLLTPERNKDRLVEVIVARGSNNVSVLESSIEEEEEAVAEEAEALEGSALEGNHVDAGFYNFLHQLPPLVTRGGPESTTSLHSSSFHHLSGDGTAAVDLSRISSNFGSDHGCGRSSDGPQTPLPSFDEDGGAGGHHPLGLDEQSFSPIQSVSSPFRIDTNINNNSTSGNDSSSLSSSGPYKKMPSFPATKGESGLSPYSQQHNGSIHSPQLPIVEGLHHQRPSSGWLGRLQDSVPESNVSTPRDKNASSASTSSSLQSTISSMINEASSFVNYVTQEVELSMEAIESLPNDFFMAMDIGGGNGGTRHDGGMDNGSTPSPISPVGSSSNSSSPENEHTKSHQLPTQSKRPKIYGRERGLSGRRRYRTVVPRRVYIGPSPSEDDEYEKMDGHQNHRPELHVSFDIQSNPETSRTNRSLLESFEEAIHRTF